MDSYQKKLDENFTHSILKRKERQLMLFNGLLIRIRSYKLVFFWLSKWIE